MVVTRDSPYTDGQTGPCRSQVKDRMGEEMRNMGNVGVVSECGMKSLELPSSQDRYCYLPLYPLVSAVVHVTAHTCHSSYMSQLIQVTARTGNRAGP